MELKKLNILDKIIMNAKIGHMKDQVKRTLEYNGLTFLLGSDNNWYTYDKNNGGFLKATREFAQKLDHLDKINRQKGL